VNVGEAARTDVPACVGDLAVHGAVTDPQEEIWSGSGEEDVLRRSLFSVIGDARI